MFSLLTECSTSACLQLRLSEALPHILFLDTSPCCTHKLGGRRRRLFHPVHGRADLSPPAPIPTESPREQPSLTTSRSLKVRTGSQQAASPRQEPARRTSSGEGGYIPSGWLSPLSPFKSSIDTAAGLLRVRGVSVSVQGGVSMISDTALECSLHCRASAKMQHLGGIYGTSVPMWAVSSTGAAHDCVISP